MVGEPAMGMVARSWWHPKTGSRVNSGTCQGAKDRFLSFNGTQSRAVTGLLTGHNTLRRHLHLMGLSVSPLCRCGAEDETYAHILCECEVLASLIRVYLGSFFLEPEEIKSISLGGHPGANLGLGRLGSFLGR